MQDGHSRMKTGSPARQAEHCWEDPKRRRIVVGALMWDNDAALKEWIALLREGHTQVQGFLGQCDDQGVVKGYCSLGLLWYMGTVTHRMTMPLMLRHSVVAANDDGAMTFEEIAEPLEEALRLKNQEIALWE